MYILHILYTTTLYMFAGLKRYLDTVHVLTVAIFTQICVLQARIIWYIMEYNVVFYECHQMMCKLVGYCWCCVYSMCVQGTSV